MGPMLQLSYRGGERFLNKEDNRQQLTLEGPGELSILQKWPMSLCSQSFTD